MFELAVKKSDLIHPLLMVAGAVDKRQSLDILSNFLLDISDNHLSIAATDLEIEITANLPCKSMQGSGKVTVPAKKLIDIVRSLDDSSEPKFIFKDNILTIREGRSSFRLATLAADNFPLAETQENEIEVSLGRDSFLSLLQSTFFALSQQDVRVFLNSLLLEFEKNVISVVATDGHRMAINRLEIEHDFSGRYLLPRKAVLELLRLLNSSDDKEVLLTAGKGHVKVSTNQYVFLTKLIDARFPPYHKAIPRSNDKTVTVDCALFKKALSRIIILANEKSKAVRLHLQSSQLTLIANNQEQEEAIESIEAKTEGDEIKIGVNAAYLLDVLSFFSEAQVHLSLSTEENSILIESPKCPNYQYILMPMKI